MGEEVNQDENGEANGMNLEVDSKDEVMHIRSVIFKEEMVGGRERVTTDEEQVLRGGSRDKVMKIARLTGCENFVGKRKKFIFNAFVEIKPVKRFENGSDM